MPTNLINSLILVVDDQASNLQVLGQILSQAGYEVMPALSGEKALSHAQVRKPDLVLLDMLMPNMDGREVCQRLHEMPGLADLPVIFVTSATERQHLIKAFEAGAVDYITKPFIVEELLARVKTHIDLKLSRDRLSVMLREREDVTNIVAHDLKNPLSCVLFAAQLMHRNENNPARRAELIDDIESCATEAMQFIQRFLVRGAEGKRLRQFSAENVDLKALAQEAMQFQRASAEVRDIQLRLEGEARSISADPTATRHVLQNLISNAIRYSPKGGEIVVSVGPSRPGYSQCLVMDRGPGIPAAEQEKLFQRFVRLVSAAEPDKYSSGLGLAIAKHDVTQMGGLLWYQDRPDGGSIFGFELPERKDV